MTALVIGFDLDMTLVDSRAGIVACMQHAVRLHGGEASEAELWPLIGAPLHANLAQFLPAEKVDAAARDYRSAYLTDAVPITTVMPGAVRLVEEIHGRGGQVIVVSAKVETAVHAVLAHVGLHPDAVIGELFAEDKATALLEHGATAYVGDHAGDMRAARTASIPGIGVTTGPHDEATLRAAGATAVVSSLDQVLAEL